FFQAEDGIRDFHVTGVQTCALPISFATRRDPEEAAGPGALAHPRTRPAGLRGIRAVRRPPARSARASRLRRPGVRRAAVCPPPRSEERRVGKEWRSGGWSRRATRRV